MSFKICYFRLQAVFTVFKIINFTPFKYLE